MGSELPDWALKNVKGMKEQVGAILDDQMLLVEGMAQGISDTYESEGIWYCAGYAVGTYAGTKGIAEAGKAVKGKVEVKGKVGEGGSNTIAKYGDDFGKMGTYVENPQIKVDWSKYAEHAAERMQQRGMTQELIDDIVNNGKVLSQNGGNEFAYITQDGVAIVSKDGKLITAWGKSNFDENMLDVISKLFGE